VPPGGVVPDPGAAVGDDIAALRAHTIKVLAEEVSAGGFEEKRRRREG